VLHVWLIYAAAHKISTHIIATHKIAYLSPEQQGYERVVALQPTVRISFSWRQYVKELDATDS